MGSIQAERAERAPATARLRGSSVLIVDDDDEVRGLLELWLKSEGAATSTAATVSEGQARLREAEFDVVLLDLDLPDGQGTQVAQAMEESNRAAIIMVTAHASPGAGRASIAAGAEQVLAKPVQKEAVVRAVEKAAAVVGEDPAASVGSIQERVRYLEQMLEITRSVATARDLETVLDRALDAMTRWLDAEGGSILLRGDGDTLVFAHAVGPGTSALIETTISVTEGIAGWVMNHGRPIAVADVRKHPHFCPAPDAQSGTTTRSILAAPLQVGGRTIGVIEVVNKRLGSFVRADRLALESVGFTLGAAIENARVHERLERSRQLILDHSQALELQVRERTTELRAANDSLAAACERLREAKDQMVHAEKMASLGSIAAGIAHEINNPIGFVGSNLNSLKGYTPAIKKMLTACRDGVPRAEIDRLWADSDFDFILEDLGALVAESQDGIDRVAKIVQDLRQFSRADESSALEAMDVNDCVRSALTLLRNELKYTVTLETDLRDVPTIQGFPGPLTQVVVNLVINAVHALDGRTGTLSVRTRVADGFAEIDVEDSGPGIPPEHAKRIFDPFFTTKEPGKGTGLGLAICYEIVQRHQGEIDLQSQPGVGTRFTVRVPLDLQTRV